MVLCDREFDSKAVYQTLSNLNVNYLIPKRIHSAERENIETMDEDGKKSQLNRPLSRRSRFARDAVSLRALNERRRDSGLCDEPLNGPKGS